MTRRLTPGDRPRSSNAAGRYAAAPRASKAHLDTTTRMLVLFPGCPVVAPDLRCIGPPVPAARDFCLGFLPGIEVCPVCCPVRSPRSVRDFGQVGESGRRPSGGFISAPSPALRACQSAKFSQGSANRKDPCACPRRRASTGQGQWALGHREPLNPNERFKQDDDGLNVRQRIETIYASSGFDSIDPSDLRGRMRWWGLYTQRRPGIGGGLTGSLEPEELDDKYFMLRVRIDGGRLTSEQLRVIGEISHDYARDTADVTDRQNVQLHWIRDGRHASDLAAARGCRTLDHRGLRRHPAGHPRLPARRE